MSRLREDNPSVGSRIVGKNRPEHHAFVAVAGVTRELDNEPITRKEMPAKRRRRPHDTGAGPGRRAGSTASTTMHAWPEDTLPCRAASSHRCRPSRRDGVARPASVRPATLGRCRARRPRPLAHSIRPRPKALHQKGLSEKSGRQGHRSLLPTMIRRPRQHHDRRVQTRCQLQRPRAKQLLSRPYTK